MIGLAKALFRFGRATDETIAARLAICNAPCPERRELFGGALIACHQCGCALAAKTIIASECCPIGEWPSEESKELPTTPEIPS